MSSSLGSSDRVIATAFAAINRIGAKYTVVTMTWGEIHTLWKAGKIDLVPAYQRGYVAPAQWRRGVVACNMQRLLPVTIYMRVLDDGRLQVMDGLQRISSMMMFLEGEIRTPAEFPDGTNFSIERGVVSYSVSELGNKTFLELQKAEATRGLAQELLGEPIITILYDKLTNHQATELFILLNNNTDMNPAEKINAILGSITDLFRKLARGVKEDGTIDLTLRVPLFLLIGVKPGRMILDDLAARCLLMEAWHLDPFYTAGIHHSKFDTHAIANFARGKVSGLLDGETGKARLDLIEKEFMRRCAIVAKWIIDSGTASKHINTTCIEDVVTLYQLTHALDKKFGSDYKTTPAFAVHLFVTLQDLCNRANYATVFTGQKTPYQAMKSSTKPDMNTQKLELILEALGTIPVGLTPLDPKRCFTREEVYAGLAKQNGVCAVTGLPLSFDDAQGGHIVAHSKGGRSIIENMIVLHKDENRKMGSTSFHEYMASRNPLLVNAA